MKQYLIIITVYALIFAWLNFLSNHRFSVIREKLYTHENLDWALVQGQNMAICKCKKEPRFGKISSCKLQAYIHGISWDNFPNFQNMIVSWKQKTRNTGNKESQEFLTMAKPMFCQAQRNSRFCAFPCIHIGGHHKSRHLFLFCWYIKFPTSSRRCLMMCKQC